MVLYTVMDSDGRAADSRNPSPPHPDSIKQYNRSKLITGVTASVVSFVLLLLLVLLGVTRSIERWAYAITAHPYGALLLFTAAIGIVQAVVTLPLSWYSGYVLEHRFHLSNQSPLRWVWERVKGLLISLPLGAAILLVLYYCMERYGNSWWLPVAIVLTVVSVLLARLAPVLILPLFYKLSPLSEGTLKERILRLSARAGLHVTGLYSFNLSKNTKKANAAFTGLGKSRRILLGDTLLNEFDEEEIETVFAHELGHYRHKHLIIGILVSVIMTFVGLFITSQLYAWSIGLLGFDAITRLAALPLLVLWLSLFGLVTTPLSNALSRRHERQADRYAVEITGNGGAFISALRKLAATNLADPAPHPLVEMLFYSHPPIGKRIALLESLPRP